LYSFLLKIKTNGNQLDHYQCCISLCNCFNLFRDKKNAKDEKNLTELLDKNEHAITDKDEAEINDGE